MAQLKEDYSDDLRVIFRHFPLSIHDKAALATQAAEAAGVQGKFWEMHDLLFESLNEWKALSPDEFESWVSEQAEDLGLDGAQFSQDLTSQEIADFAKETWETNSSIGIPGTPFIVINGQPYQGGLSYGNLSSVIELALFEQQQYEDCPPMTIDPQKEYVATLETEKGDVEIELYPAEAPLAVNSFVFLAEEGWFDDIIFHRVIPGFVAQTGDPTGTGMGGPGYEFDNETSSDLSFDQPGLLGMANSGPDTNGSQFFITYSEVPHLDAGYTIFGRVISGMDVVESLVQRDPSQPGELPEGDRILGVTIVEN